MNPFKNRYMKTVALAGLIALQGAPTPARAQDTGGKKTKEPTAAQQEQQQGNSQMLNNGFQMPGARATEAAKAQTQAEKYGGELHVDKNGIGVFEGYVVTRDSRRKIAIGFRGDEQTKIYLVIRGIYGREGSFLGVLMHPTKGHERVALYRIDPRANGKYVMTRLSKEDGNGYATSFISVEQLNPEISLNIRGGTLLLSSASGEAKRIARNQHDDYFTRIFDAEKDKQVQFNPASTLVPTPAVQWTDGPASIDADNWTGSYRGMYLSPASHVKAFDNLFINPMDVTQKGESDGSCSFQDPCYTTAGEFSFLSDNEAHGDFKLVEGYPGMYVFSKVESKVDGEHTEYGKYIGVYLRTGIPKDGAFESKAGTENKLYLVDPSNTDDIIVVKR